MDVTTYELRVEGICPNDPLVTDDYTLLVETRDGLIEVERILEVVDELTKEPIYQEDLTRRIRDELRDDSGDFVVTMTGEHLGVKTTCVCS